VVLDAVANVLARETALETIVVFQDNAVAFVEGFATITPGELFEHVYFSVKSL
jgi:hypothetical protein